MCSLYIPVLNSGDPSVIGLGYLHYALVSALSIVFGWVQLPRELRGVAPVTLPLRAGKVFFAAMILMEIALHTSLLLFHSWPPSFYLVCSLLQLAASLTLFFRHRHELVIYTENVTELLEERTASLRQARTELARQNEIQAQKLDEQAKEIEAKAVVIDRQRRLELAAQTAGQAVHDIQNLISPMLVHLSTLEKPAATLPDRHKAIATIRRQIDSVLGLNTQLLSLARRGRLDQSPIDMRELVLEMASAFPLATIHQQISGDPWISGTWSQLSRAVSNLVSNAIDAGNECGNPAIFMSVAEVAIRETRRCHLGFLAPGRYVCIKVHDRGPGIRPEHIDQIFQPFFSSKKGNHASGSGLGLSIVAAVVDDHKGILDLETSSSGTCFAIFFPAIERPGSATSEDELSHNETVIVTDDDSSVLARCSQILTEAGYNVITCKSGDELLRLIQVESADAVLLDLAMPQRDGFEALYGLRHLRPDIRVIIHSSYISPEGLSRLQELAPAEILHKPVGRSELLRTLRRVLNDRPKIARAHPY
jgi:signal transduction histidine kinase/CheY-like chemotaxis protein